MDPVTATKLGIQAALFVKNHWRKIIVVICGIMFLFIGLFSSVVNITSSVGADDEVVELYKEVAEESGLYWPDLLLYHAVMLYNDFTNVTIEDVRKAAKEIVKYELVVTNLETDFTQIYTYKFDQFYDDLINHWGVPIDEKKEKLTIKELAEYGHQITRPKYKFELNILYYSITDPEIWHNLTSDQVQLYEALSQALPYQFGLVPMDGDGGSTIPGQPPGSRPPDIDVDFAWPAPDLTGISSNFGERVDPINGKKDFHTGVDLNLPGDADIGKDVIASADGVVYQVVKDASGACGYNIRIKHGGDVQTRYCHLSAIFVKPGQEVEQGDVIGSAGKTGRVTGAHLHFEMKYKGVLVDPLPYIISTRP
ncbi:M23 family metallopeptidase [Brevibacillus brevis]|uniref:M23 family metallopeptidase n=1 Tax=Brevibacillus brevis TaxID=1393 RepID=A0ABY9TCW1_BREBE|nr:M23 family metallopeptidase [Brevibacillus brevis]WNC17949.1 M23 family metallopeptidase [Brevibacillus brevis]